MAEDERDELLGRITYNPEIFGGKPIIRGHRMAVEHILDMLAMGSTAEEILRYHSWLEPEDLLACLEYAYRVVANERVAPLGAEQAA